MSQALTRYNALYDSIRSRRRRSELPRGLDLLTARVSLAVRSRKISRAWLAAQAGMIDALSPSIRNHSEGALDAAIAETREAFIRDRRDDELVRRGLALTREVARRATGEEAFRVQLMGALALYHGRIIEMLTGEGKTLTGSIAAPLLAWRHKHLHVFTVNDYLAKRDANSRGAIYRRCLLRVGAIHQDLGHQDRFEVYSLPIVYGTPKQITADWLRDQIRLGAQNTPWAGRQSAMLGGEAGAGPMIPGLQAALVDEADAVLIDEGVVPLIIARSRRTDEMSEVYRRAAAIAASLDEGPDYSVDQLRRRADLKPRGRHRCEQTFSTLDEPIWKAKRRAEELIRQGLVAKHCYLRGHQYQIVDGRVVIVDEYTGRFLPDRNWEHGLHQAVEAKEAVDVTADRETLARMSFQRFFRSYPFLCGMTGTAADATGEMKSVYARPVIVVPTNRPVIRAQWPTRVFRTQEAKWNAIAQSIEDLHTAGRPALVGTRSIFASEHLSQKLQARSLPHRVLNANFDKEEAEMIAGAGRGGGGMASITVATNMAGRGTDIKPDEPALLVGGLHVVLTEMHTAKRIDRQFIGRAGRQGDAGSAQIFVSLEDELPRLYARRLAEAVKATSHAEELSGRLRALAVRLFRLAQRRAEARARRGRSDVLKQDDWIEKHLPGT
jgi:preprotein translocase subunit SecA